VHIAEDDSVIHESEYITNSAATLQDRGGAVTLPPGVGEKAGEGPGFVADDYSLSATSADGMALTIAMGAVATRQSPPARSQQVHLDVFTEQKVTRLQLIKARTLFQKKFGF
jgi:hypothetical protein